MPAIVQSTIHPLKKIKNKLKKDDSSQHPNIVKIIIIFMWQKEKLRIFPQDWALEPYPAREHSACCFSTLMDLCRRQICSVFKSRKGVEADVRQVGAGGNCGMVRAGANLKVGALVLTPLFE